MSFFKKRKQAEAKPVTTTGITGVNFRRNGDLGNSALWACVMLLARTYSTLPLHVYEYDRKHARQRVDDRRPLPVLIKKPNPHMTHCDFFFIMGFNYELHGEAIAIIERSRDGIPIALYPVSPSQVVASWKGDDLYYTVVGESSKTYPASEILDIKATPSSYTTVLDPISYASTDLELEEKCKAIQKEFFDGGTIMGRSISVPDRYTPEERAVVQAAFDSLRRTGTRNVVHSDSVKIESFSVQNGEIQRLINASKWNLQEVARRFNVPVFMLGDSSGTYNNTEHQLQEFITYCIQPRIVVWETAMEDKLGYSGQFLKFSLQGLLRGDHASRSAYYHNAIMDGWMSINEVRSLEELPPVKDGDQHFFPMNYTTLGKVGEVTSAWESEEHDHGAIEEEDLREKDKRFMERLDEVTKTERRAIERKIRAMLKKELAKVEELRGQSLPVDQLLNSFRDWINSEQESSVADLSGLYKKMMDKMIPVIRSEIGSDQEITDEKIKEFINSYSQGLYSRHTGYVYKRVSYTVDTEDYEETVTELEDHVAAEGKEESVRSSNAFSQFCYAALGLEYMHIVAAADACSFCRQLDGRVCSVQGYVITKGDMDDGDGGVRHISKNYRHPPFHTGCECRIAPGR